MPESHKFAKELKHLVRKPYKFFNGVNVIPCTPPRYTSLTIQPCQRSYILGFTEAGLLFLPLREDNPLSANLGTKKPVHLQDILYTTALTCTPLYKRAVHSVARVHFDCKTQTHSTKQLQYTCNIVK
jgi:hypothetical protein